MGPGLQTGATSLHHLVVQLCRSLQRCACVTGAELEEPGKHWTVGKRVELHPPGRCPPPSPPKLHHHPLAAPLSSSTPEPSSDLFNKDIWTKSCAKPHTKHGTGIIKMFTAREFVSYLGSKARRFLGTQENVNKLS